MAVAIGLSSCADSKCYPPADVMGTILYNGPFKPEFHESTQPPYQNFSVNIPEAFAKGEAQLNVAHVSLVGVSCFVFSLWGEWMLTRSRRLDLFHIWRH